MPVGYALPDCSQEQTSYAGCHCATAKHTFLPIQATVAVFERFSHIALTSPSAYLLEILVRVGDQAVLVALTPNGSGSCGSRVVPKQLDLSASVTLLACMQPGDEQ